MNKLSKRVHERCDPDGTRHVFVTIEVPRDAVNSRQEQVDLAIMIARDDPPPPEGQGLGDYCLPAEWRVRAAGIRGDFVRVERISAAPKMHSGGAYVSTERRPKTRPQTVTVGCEAAGRSAYVGTADIKGPLWDDESQTYQCFRDRDDGVYYFQGVVQE